MLWKKGGSVSCGGISRGGESRTNFEGGEIVWLAGRDVLERCGVVRRRSGGLVITAADVNVKNVRSAVMESSLNSSIFGRQRISSALLERRRSGGRGTICTG